MSNEVPSKFKSLMRQIKKDLINNSNTLAKKIIGTVDLTNKPNTIKHKCLLCLLNEPDLN